MQIRAKILLNVCAVVLVTVMLAFVAVQWSLTAGVKKQVDSLSSGLLEQLEQKGKANADVSKFIINSFEKEAEKLQRMLQPVKPDGCPFPGCYPVRLES